MAPRQRAKPVRRNPTASAEWFEATSLPFIIDMIFTHADDEALFALRRVCTTWRDRADQKLVRRLVLETRRIRNLAGGVTALCVTTPSGRRIPRQRWASTKLIRHVKVVDLKGNRRMNSPRWLERLPRLAMLRDSLDGVDHCWIHRPLADTHILVQSPHGSEDVETNPTDLVIVPRLGPSRWEHAPFVNKFLPCSLAIVLLDPPDGYLAACCLRYRAFFTELARTVAGVLARQVACELSTPVALVNVAAWYPLQMPAPLASGGGPQPLGYGDEEFKKEVQDRLLAKMGNFADRAVARDLVEQVEFLSLGHYRAKVGERLFEAVSTIHTWR